MTITLTREEAQQVLDALSTEGIGENSYRAAELLRARLSAPEPEPVAWMHRQGNYTEPHSMRLDDDAKARGWTEEPLYTAPLQRDEPEPHGYLWFTQYMEQRFTHRKPEERERIGDVKPLYTAPPQREWQGLIMEEVQEILNDPRYQIKPLIVHAVEAKLKEKNGE